jgi:hypothetical protein
VPVIWFEDVRVALSQSKFPIRPLRGRAIVGSHTYYACWANMLLDLGIEEYPFPLSRVAVMSLKPDATAPYCYITKETLILCAVLLGCNTLLVQNEILIIRGRRIAIQVQCSELRTMSARTSATDRAFVWSKPSSKRHVHLRTVRWPSRKGDLS